MPLRETDASRLQVEDVGRVVLAAGHEAVDRRPGLPAAGVLDLENQAPFDHRPMGQVVLLVGVGGAGAQEFGGRQPGLDELHRVDTEPAQAAEGRGTRRWWPAGSEPEEHAPGGVGVVDLRR